MSAKMAQFGVFVAFPPLQGDASRPGPGAPQGLVGRGSTGRSQPLNLLEKMAMDQAREHPAAGTPVPVKGGMNDPRWPASQGWVKMRQNHFGVEVHYVRNTFTGQVDDFKFK
jgi:hypothetical protein